MIQEIFGNVKGQKDKISLSQTCKRFKNVSLFVEGDEM